MLYLALGILGATVMPHNLYLHSGVVQTRRFGDSVEERREAIKLATVDSTIALMFALLINAVDPDPRGRDLQQGRADRCRRARPGAFVPGAAARLRHRADAVRHRAAVLRPELDRDGDARRPDRDGGLHRHPPAGLGAAADHARDRDRAGRDRDDLVRRGRAPRKLLILSQVILSLAAAVRDRAAGDVHRRPRARWANWSRRAG